MLSQATCRFPRLGPRCGAGAGASVGATGGPDGWEGAMYTAGDGDGLVSFWIVIGCLVLVCLVAAVW